MMEYWLIYIKVESIYVFTNQMLWTFANSQSFRFLLVKATR